MDRRPLLPGAVVAMLAIALAIYLIEKIGQALLAISNVILLVALAWILTLMLRPAVNWIHGFTLPDRLIRPLRQRWGARVADRFMHPSYGYSILIVYLLLLAVVSIIVLALIPLVIEQTRQLVITLQQQANALPYLIQRVTEIVTNARDFLITRLNIDPALVVLPRPEEIAGQITGFASNLLQIGFSIVGTIAATLGQAMLVVFLSAFIMLDGKETTRSVMRLVPRQYEPDVNAFLKTSELAFSGFIRGTALQGLIYGLGVTIFMTIFGIGSPLAVGVITGVLMVIPVVGGVLGLLIPLLAALLQSSPNTVWLMICLVVFEVVLFNFIAPRLISQSVKIPALLVIVGILIGWQLMGFWGFVFAVPVVAVVYSIGLVILERAVRQHEQENNISASQGPHMTGPSNGYAVRGARIDQVQPFAFDRGPIGCVLLHGFTAAPKEMRLLGDYLAARNYTVRGVRYAGHGTSPQDLARTTRRDWVASAAEAVAQLRGRCTQVWWIGLSLGGLIGLQLAEQHLVDGVCAMAPAMFPPDRRMAIARLITPFRPYTRKDLADLQDPIALTEHADYELFPTRAVAELNALMRHIRRHLAQIDVPLLLIFARHDRVVPLDTLDYIWPRVASADKQQLILERGGHIVTEDYDKEIAFAAIERFLRQHS